MHPQECERAEGGKTMPPTHPQHGTSLLGCLLVQLCSAALTLPPSLCVRWGSWLFLPSPSQLYHLCSEDVVGWQRSLCG